MLDDPSVILTDKLTDIWNDQMTQLVTGLVGLINVEGIPVGKFVSVLISFFWPSTAVDIWELVKEGSNGVHDGQEDPCCRVTLSYMHLANLKERLMHGKEIYDEDNTPTWRKELKEEIET
ncbi:hypothetical protein NDU88_002813 [Pleurodeles waltl]|uniref:Uncharacterized protein n=1 Tax=Pleurodeles waltl TaxID=8319 RepID=A0AAV7SDZ3_PLEWA|nr:hypothetical protein NDU88_002813 [Pleurodeles waltl]